VATLRQKIVTAARWGIAHEPQIHYGELRPVPLGRTLPLTTDCSGFVTLCFFLAGAPDPNGLGYSGEGWTGTLLRHLARTDAARARRGDLVVWGDYPGRHVALVLEPGADPLLASHGQERGPIAVRFSVEDAWQGVRAAWLDGLVQARVGRAAVEHRLDEVEPDGTEDPSGRNEVQSPLGAPDGPGAEDEHDRPGAEPHEHVVGVAAALRDGDDAEREQAQGDEEHLAEHEER
jgi:hypothetical protein